MITNLVDLRDALHQFGITVTANPLVVTDRVVRIDGDQLVLRNLDLCFRSNLINPGIMLLAAPGINHLTLINCRLYPGRVARPGSNLDAMQIGSDTPQRVGSVELINCSFGFGTDENLSAWNTDSLTIIRCLDWFALHEAGHTPDPLTGITAHSMLTQFVNCGSITTLDSAYLHGQHRGLRTVRCQHVLAVNNVYLVDNVYSFNHCPDVQLMRNTILGQPNRLLEQTDSVVKVTDERFGINPDAVTVLSNAGVFPRKPWEQREIQRILNGGGLKLIDSETEVVK